MAIVLYALTALLYCALAYHGWATRHAGLATAAGTSGLAGQPGSMVLVPGPRQGGIAEGQPAWWHGLMVAALASHGLLLHETIFPADRMMFGFAFALSAMLWLGVGIYWIESFFFSLAGLGLVVIPVAMIASLMPLAFPGGQILGYAARPLFKLHFIIANVAYGLFTLAAFHAFLMLLVERRLHGFNRGHGGAKAAGAPREAAPQAGWLGRWLDLLPPLLTLEKLLFRLIAAGFVLLTLTIASGVLFSEELFGRAVRFDHKNMFAVISWVMFAGILAGRRFYGWRGRVALRWVIASFGILLLAYVGSRFVIEVILHRL